MKQSPNDDKKYQAITLDNGLRVLLIQNLSSQKAAAALAVNVGHFSDPPERQGMAHFLEHMLFLGTKSYPDGSEYQKFISQYGGSNNAWTSTEHTCFFFDIHHHHLEEALHRFGQFFSSPLLSEEFVNKERQNIDAEFKLKLKDDIRRLYDVHKETINPAHPFSKFSVGSCDTLADKPGSNLRDEVQSFFEQYYRAQYMTLAIEGPQSIADLTRLAQENFSEISSTNTIKEQITVPLYLPEHQQKLIKVKPVKNDKQLIISFAMPAIDHLYRHKPESVLAYLLGHEGPGSILSLLKNKQWALGLTAGSGINGSNFKDFNINIPLTELGEKNLHDVVSVVFSYINLIKKQVIAEHYYLEKKSIAELSFNYQEKLRPTDSVSQLVLNMQHYPPEDYIFGDYVMDGMCEEKVNQLLSYLTPENMRLIHISQQNTFSQTSKWYQVPYHVEQISDEHLNNWRKPTINSALNLPAKNLYITSNPKVLAAEKKEPITTPQCIEKQDGLSVWFKQDNTFNIPKGYIYIGIDTPTIISSVKSIAAAHLFVDLFSDAIVEEHYDAELAGIHYHLYAHQGGMTLQLSGISEKQPQLLEKLLINLTNYTFSLQRFELIKQQLIIHWKNADKSKSISQLFSKLSSIMQPKNPESDVLAEQLSSLTFEEFIDFTKTIFDKVSLDVLIHGNWHLHHAEAISQLIKNRFLPYCSDNFRAKVPVIDIQGKTQITFPLILEDHDYATVNYYPLADKELTTIAKTMVTSHLLSPLFFQEMRTEKQFGYLVGVGFVPINRYPGIAFYIQSPHTSSLQLMSAIDDFIIRSNELLSDMSLDDWQHLQHGLSSQLQEKDSSLRIKSQRFWAAISNDEQDFNKKAQLIKAIQALSLDDIKNFIHQSLMSTQAPDRLNLMSFKCQQDLAIFKENINVIENIEEIADICQRKY